MLRDHVHFVVSRPNYRIEQLVNRPKAGATQMLDQRGLHPFQEYPRIRGRLPKMWGRGRWNVFLDSNEEIVDRVDYVQSNPIKQGLPPQRWSFVVPYAT